MADYDHDLLEAASRLVRRHARQRGRLPSAQVRRGVSTAYYAMFHFLLGEATRALVGSHHDLRRRRRTLARLFSHAGLKKALGKVSGANVHDSVANLLRPRGSDAEAVASPTFARDVARVFADAQAARQDADYDLNVEISEADAHVLLEQIRGAIANWRAADSAADRDFKHALSLLMLLKGELAARGDAAR